MNNTITRSIYYYNLITYYRDERDNLKRSENSDNIIIDFFKKLEYLKENKDPSMMVEMKSGNKMFIVIDKELDDRINFKLVLSRRDAIPFLEREGELESLEAYLEKDQNIAEITHGVYFKGYNTIAVEYNFSGARVSAIAYYIKELMEIVDYAQCTNILQLDAYKKLHKEKDYSLFDLTIKNNTLLHNKLMENTSIFKINENFDEVETYEVVLKKRKTKKNGYKGFNLPFTYDLMEDILQNYREDIKAFKVSQNAIGDSVDLLTDKCVKTIKAAKVNNRYIDSESLFEQANAYFVNVVSKFCEKIEVK